jgi:hypothetical protein
MLKSPSEFISRFLYHVHTRDDEFYWEPGTAPTPQVVAQASGALKDVLGFAEHQGAFSTLAEVIDICTAEELGSKGNGIAARNSTKHPSVVALTKLNALNRASVAAAAAQGLAWMQECKKWVSETRLRNQIAIRVMTGIIVAVGRIKKGYSPAQLAALARIATSLESADHFILRSRGAIVEILAGNLNCLPRDEGTISAMRGLLDTIAAYPNAVPVFDAMDKLLHLTSAEHAAKLEKMASQWK